MLTRALCILLVVAGSSWAGEEEKARIDELERRNEQLEERLRKLEEGNGVPSPEALLEEEMDEYLAEGIGLNVVIRNGDVQGIVQLFGSVGSLYRNPEVAGRSNTYFLSGTFDLFVTVRAGDHFHGLSETVFLTSLGDDPKDSGAFDQERLWAAWRFSDLVQIKMGLEHGPVSRWNQQFHHGQWLETTVLRPFLAAFEGSGGILPMHNAGIELSGAFSREVGRFNYVVFLSNGRGRIPTDTQEFSDRNDGKAVDFLLGFAPEAVRGLWVGVVWRIDDIPENLPDPLRQRSIRQVIGSFQVDYQRDKLAVLFEFVYIEDRDRQSMTTYGHYATYLQIAYSVTDEWVPYVRLDVREMDSGDPYYMPFDRDLDAWEALFGVRHNLLDNAAIKFEVGFGERQQRDSGGGLFTRSYIRIGLQIAWVF